MDMEQVRELCLSMHGKVEECSPFADLGYPDDCFRIGGKIFAYIWLDGRRTVVLKCDPDRAIDLRDRYPDVVEPAWHWNKKYWNQVHYELLPEPVMRDFVQHSFDEVAAGLPKRVKAELWPDRL